MMIGNYNLEIYQGESFSTQMILSGENGIINLSGCSITGEIKNQYYDTGNIIAFQIDKILDESGIINLSLSHLQTSGLPTNISFYDINIFNNSGDYIKSNRGYVYIYPQITY